MVKPGAVVLYPSNMIIVSAFVCFDCAGEVKKAAAQLRTGLEINGPTLEQAIIGDVQRMAAGQKDPNLAGRPFVNHATSALAKLHRRGRITDLQYVAGDQYRSIWMRSGLNSRVSSAYGAGTGGGECTYGMAATEVVAHNRKLLRAAQAAIGDRLGKSNGHEWFDMVAVYDCSRIDVGYRVCDGVRLNGKVVSRSTASTTGKAVIGKCLDALVDHFRIKAPEWFTGKSEPLYGDGAPSREDVAAGLRRAAGEGDDQVL